jgi:hypothetical protein
MINGTTAATQNHLGQIHQLIETNDYARAIDMATNLKGQPSLDQ